jgi:hypothetical protein
VCVLDEYRGAGRLGSEGRKGREGGVRTRFSLRLAEEGWIHAESTDWALPLFCDYATPPELGKADDGRRAGGLRDVMICFFFWGGESGLLLSLLLETSVGGIGRP